MAIAAPDCARADSRARGTVTLAALALSLGAPAQADPVSVVEGLRTTGCSGVAAAGATPQRSSALDAAARELARNRTLDDALGRVGFPAATATSFHVRGSSDDAAIRRILAARYCETINEPAFDELGVYQRGDSTWIVLAGRTAQPFAALRDPAAVARRVLELVNRARAVARRCGRDVYEAAPALSFSPALMAAASLHSLDMAERGSLGHEGSDGSAPGERVTRAGYAWQASGENVAAGQSSAEIVVAAWLDSPGHCATLMQSRFTETGVAFALAPGQNPAVYWTQVFAAPR